MQKIYTLFEIEEKENEKEKPYRQFLEDEKRAREKWEFRSKSDPNKFYTVKWIKYKGLNILGCNCPEWIYNKNKDRTCKHTIAVQDMINQTKTNRAVEITAIKK